MATLPIKTKKPPKGHNLKMGGMPEELRQGKPIVDALEYLAVNLTADDVRKGKPLDPGRCAFACAVDREYDVQAFIWRTTAYVDFGDVIVRFRVPASMRTELVSVDRHGDMAAGEYWLAPPTPKARLGIKPSGRKDQKKVRAAAKAKRPVIAKSVRVRA